MCLVFLLGWLNFKVNGMITKNRFAIFSKLNTLFHKKQAEGYEISDMNVWGAHRIMPAVVLHKDTLDAGSASFILTDGRSKMDISLALRYGDLRIGVLIHKKQFQAILENPSLSREWDEILTNGFGAYSTKVHNPPVIVKKEFQHGWFIDFIFDGRPETELLNNALKNNDVTGINANLAADAIFMHIIHIYHGANSARSAILTKAQISSNSLVWLSVITRQDPADFLRENKLDVSNLYVSKHAEDGEQGEYVVFCAERESQDLLKKFPSAVVMDQSNYAMA